MRKIILFCIAVILPVTALADQTGDRNELLYGSVINISASDYKDTVAALEQEIQKIDPQVIESARNLNPLEKLAKYRAAIAGHAFAKIKDSYVAAINKYANKIGRTVKTTQYDEVRDANYHMIDGSEKWNVIVYEINGGPDRTKCVSDPHGGPNLCFFPDGYEHYEIIYAREQQSGNKETLVVTYDDAAANITHRVTVSRSVFPALGERESFLATDVTTRYYADVQKERNQIIEDLAQGMSIRECNGMLECIVAGERIKYYTYHDNLENAEWKSGYIPEYIGREYTRNHK